MKNHDFIKSNIGNKVYITGDGDLGFSGGMIASAIKFKIPMTIVKLTKAGNADDWVEYYSVPPRNVCEILNDVKPVR